VFIVTSGDEHRYASVNSRVLSYSHGFKERAAYVGETYMLQLVPFREGDLVVDCGASMGDLENYLRQNGHQVSYIGFEANPRDYVCLQKNVGSEKSRNVGLWNRVGSIPFYVNDALASSSFIQPPEFTKIVNIPSSTLSELFPKEKIRLLKLEAEGAEPEVLEGALEILGNIDYVSADVGPERGVLEEETRDFVVTYLKEAGFDLVQEKNGYRKIVLLKRRGAE
jgi:FkbM family methyltransferase